MGLLFPAFKGVQDQARKTQAKNDLTQVVTAVNAYYTEYGKYPVPGAATNTPDDYWITASNNADLLNVLRANGVSWDNPNSGGTNLNPRRVVFLNPPFAKDPSSPRGGISQNDGKFYDPWGSAYQLRIDWDYNNQIANPYSDTDGSAGATTINAGVIAFSFGKNGALGGGTRASTNFSDESGLAGKYKDSSDAISWQ